MGLITAFLTAFYMFRLWFMTFSGEPRDHHIYDHAHESPKVMWIPLAILAVLAFGSGFSLLFGFESTIAPGGVFAFDHVTSAVDMLVAVFTNPLTYASIIAAVAGIVLAYLMYNKRSIDAAMFTATPARKAISNVLLNRYGFTKAYDWIGLKVVYGIAKVADALDRRVIDGFINWVSAGLIRAGSFLRRGQTGFVQNYAAVIVAGVSLIAILLFLIGGI